MNLTCRTLSWAMALSLLGSGCYSTAVLGPSRNLAERIGPDTIMAVVTKEDSTFTFGKRYRIDEAHASWEAPAAVVGDSVIWYSRTQRVAMPFADVAEVHVKKLQPVETAVAVVSVAGAIAAVVLISEWIKNMEGMSHAFDGFRPL